MYWQWNPNGKVKWETRAQEVPYMKVTLHRGGGSASAADPPDPPSGYNFRARDPPTHPTPHALWTSASHRSLHCFLLSLPFVLPLCFLNERLPSGTSPLCFLCAKHIGLDLLRKPYRKYSKLCFLAWIY